MIDVMMKFAILNKESSIGHGSMDSVHAELMDS